MIPALDERGLLPAGIHQAAGWEPLQAAFCWNEHRHMLLGNLRRWVDVELQLVAAGLGLVVGGSFLTSKAVPSDIDCTVLMPLNELSAYGAALQLLLEDGAKGRIWKDFGVEVYPTIQCEGMNDFSAYFQYVGDKSAVIHQCGALDRRGVIQIDPWLPG